jgi:hypothetical protein
MVTSMKDRYSSFVFFATRSPSFVIPTKQYLRLTQHHCDDMKKEKMQEVCVDGVCEKNY